MGIVGGKGGKKKPGKKGLTAGLRVPTWVGTETPMEEA